MSVEIYYHPRALVRVKNYQNTYRTKEKPSWAYIQELLVLTGFQERVLPAKGTQLTREQIKHLYFSNVMNGASILPVVQSNIQCNNSSKVG